MMLDREKQKKAQACHNRNRQLEVILENQVRLAAAIEAVGLSLSSKMFKYHFQECLKEYEDRRWKSILEMEQETGDVRQALSGGGRWLFPRTPCHGVRIHFGPDIWVLNTSGDRAPMWEKVIDLQPPEKKSDDEVPFIEFPAGSTVEFEGNLYQVIHVAEDKTDILKYKAPCFLYDLISLSRGNVITNVPGDFMTDVKWRPRENWWRGAPERLLVRTTPGRRRGILKGTPAHTACSRYVSFYDDAPGAVPMGVAWSCLELDTQKE